VSRKLPAYLWRNRHGTYYFRLSLNSDRAGSSSRREGRRSLGTDSRAAAEILVLPFRWHYLRSRLADQGLGVKKKTRVDESPGDLQFDLTTVVRLDPERRVYLESYQLEEGESPE
jgi:hypothetical protein